MILAKTVFFRSLNGFLTGFSLNVQGMSSKSEVPTYGLKGSLK